MKLTIHRGTHQIGGSCVEIQSGDTRIIIDIGFPLTDETGEDFNLRKYKKLSPSELIKNKILPDVKGLYEFDKNVKYPNAIIISHSHPDHYGFLQFARRDIPVYLSKGCLQLIKATYYFGRIDCDLSSTAVVQNGKDFVINDIKITPYLMDHSGFDSYGFLIEAEGKRIFYSGDFRGHGRKKTVFERFIKNPPRDIDCLIMEGTRIQESGGTCKTEEELRDELVKVFKKQKGLIFFACSTQNIDRLSMLYSACRRSGKILVIDPYTAFLLDSLKEISKGIPQFNWKNIRIFFAVDSHTKKMGEDETLFKFKGAKISYPEIEKEMDRIVIKSSYAIRKAFGKKGYTQGAALIYSMWKGYFKSEAEYWQKYGISPLYIHTSGHAGVDALKKMAEALNPKNIIPIHTQFPQSFCDHFGSKVLNIQDGAVHEIA